jgi:hypothetical protein
VKLAAAVTTSVAVVEWIKSPLVPVIVSVYVPVGVEDEVVTVSVEVPVPGTDVGLNVPVAPFGNPPTLNVTAPLNPSEGVTVGV